MFIERYNKKFAVSAVGEPDVSCFRSLSSADIEHYISFAYETIVGNDTCVRLGGLTIPIPKGKGWEAASYAKKKVFVRQHLDGSWSVWDMGRKWQRLFVKRPCLRCKVPVNTNTHPLENRLEAIKRKTAHQRDKEEEK